MRSSNCYGVIFILAINGCTSSTEPGRVPSDQGSEGAAEKTVRAIISDLLRVERSAVQMDKPICDPPLNADELDSVEIVMELEERLGVEITDAAVERRTGAKFGKGPSRITPKQLVAIVTEAPKLRRAKRKK